MHLAAHAIKHTEILADIQQQGAQVLLEDEDFGTNKYYLDGTKSATKLLEVENENALDMSTDSSDSMTDSETQSYATPTEDEQQRSTIPFGKRLPIFQ